MVSLRGVLLYREMRTSLTPPVFARSSVPDSIGDDYGEDETKYL